MPRVPKGFPEAAAAALCHSDPGRFALLYRLLWRLQDQPRLLDIAPDPDVAALRRMVKAVGRDCHKMHAFVRFRELDLGAGTRRRFAAWFEPDHHILARATPFFARRFADMDWAILTPRGQALFRDGILRTDEAPCDKPDLDDPTEAPWRTYFSATFNPARLKIKAMTSEMPRKYWKNLPEAGRIPGLSRRDPCAAAPGARTAARRRWLAGAALGDPGPARAVRCMPRRRRPCRAKARARRR
ncbi:MAG: TIGR03915 family putative DNA repair protein [Paracoccus sp. (in: a-proteobacteria)]|uniref:TIGR03915 family putative DNA repair protein n=1 Tax=Paracoccus sp. TaxID=267 RepID=UPI0039E4E9E5